MCNMFYLRDNITIDNVGMKDLQQSHRNNFDGKYEIISADAAIAYTFQFNLIKSGI